MANDQIYAIVDYEDEYVQKLLLSALSKCIGSENIIFVKSIKDLPSPSAKVLQWVQYESIDFEHSLSNTKTSLANSYMIRKALIRKHYLSTVVTYWLAKQPGSILRDHVKPSVEFEVDYAEFLDDALVDAWDLKESWAMNDSLDVDNKQKEWWILKPGMSERGQGIRLFSSEEELTEIFEEWDPPSEDDEDEAEDDQQTISDANGASAYANAVRTSHLRHFIAQPYIDRPLLLPDPHASAGRKFHVRTYVVATGALKVYVYRPMLALFAEQLYAAPTPGANDELNRHLTNTCLQTGEREGSVNAFWSLPSKLTNLPGVKDWREDVYTQIFRTTSELFLAAARTMGTHFQPLPNAFEIFAIDFLVDETDTAWLLEVNAFPDFKQTGEELKDVVEGLFIGVVDVAIKPFFGMNDDRAVDDTSMVEALNVDLGRH